MTLEQLNETLNAILPHVESVHECNNCGHVGTDVLDYGSGREDSETGYVDEYFLCAECEGGRQ